MWSELSFTPRFFFVFVNFSPALYYLNAWNWLDAHKQLYMLWFNFILGLNFIFLCFNVMIRRGSQDTGFHSFTEIGQIFHNKKMYKIVYKKTSNNQRLRSAGDNDRRSKRFRSSAVLCVSFTWQKVKPRVNSLRVIEGSNSRYQIMCISYTLSGGPNKLLDATYS